MCKCIKVHVQMYLVCVFDSPERDVSCGSTRHHHLTVAHTLTARHLGEDEL